MTYLTRIISLVIVTILTDISPSISSERLSHCVRTGQLINICHGATTEDSGRVIVHSVRYGYVPDLSGSAHVCQNTANCTTTLSGGRDSGLVKDINYISCSGRLGCDIEVGTFTIPQCRTEANFVIIEYYCITDASILRMSDNITATRLLSPYLAYFSSLDDDDLVNITCRVRGDRFSLRAVEVHFPIGTDCKSNQLKIWYHNQGSPLGLRLQTPKTPIRNMVYSVLLTGMDTIIINYINCRTCGRRTNIWWKIETGTVNVSCRRDVNLHLCGLSICNGETTDTSSWISSSSMAITDIGTEKAVGTEKRVGTDTTIGMGPTVGTEQAVGSEKPAGTATTDGRNTTGRTEITVATIAGSVVGGSILIIVVLVVIIICYRRRSQINNKVPKMHGVDCHPEIVLTNPAYVERSMSSQEHVYEYATNPYPTNGAVYINDCDVNDELPDHLRDVTTDLTQRCLGAENPGPVHDGYLLPQVSENNKGTCNFSVENHMYLNVMSKPDVQVYAHPGEVDLQYDRLNRNTPEKSHVGGTTDRFGDLSYSTPYISPQPILEIYDIQNDGEKQIIVEKSDVSSNGDIGHDDDHYYHTLDKNLQKAVNLGSPVHNHEDGYSLARDAEYPSSIQTSP